MAATASIGTVRLEAFTKQFLCCLPYGSYQKRCRHAAEWLRYCLDVRCERDGLIVDNCVPITVLDTNSTSSRRPSHDKELPDTCLDVTCELDSMIVDNCILITLRPYHTSRHYVNIETLVTSCISRQRAAGHLKAGHRQQPQK
jgi:hypothetical protein